MNTWSIHVLTQCARNERRWWIPYLFTRLYAITFSVVF